jgi:hypothetical protein
VDDDIDKLIQIYSPRFSDSIGRPVHQVFQEILFLAGCFLQGQEKRAEEYKV